MPRIDLITKFIEPVVNTVRSAEKTSHSVINSSVHSVPEVLTATNKTFLNRIRSIPTQGVGDCAEDEQIMKLLNTAMYELLGKTNGKANLFDKIVFAKVVKNNQKQSGVMCVNDGVLYLNRYYFSHIDEYITKMTNDFMNMGYITKDKAGKYKIVDYLRNGKSEIFEKRLNEYNHDWPLDYKYKFHQASMSYFANLTNQSRTQPVVMIENVMKHGNNQVLLKQKGLFKSRTEVENMQLEEQQKYLQTILSNKQIILPEDTALIKTPLTSFWHESGHLNHAGILTEEQLSKLRSPEKIKEWQNNPKIQEVCSRVSGYAKSAPLEFVAEVYSGLVNGQKFHPDVMNLYKTLKGPIV